MSDVARFIDESPMLNLIFDIGRSAVGVAGRAAAGFASGASELTNGVLGFVGEKSTSLGSSMIPGKSGPEISPVRELAMAIEPARNTAQDFNAQDLCTLSAPTFGCGPAGRGTGMGM